MEVFKPNKSSGALPGKNGKAESVIILSYYFPPSNYTAASRAYTYARYFHENGIYPIIITRNWDQKIESTVDASKDSGTQIRVEKHDGYEVHYLPFKGNFKDRFILKHGLQKHRVVRKILTGFELFLQNFTIRYLSFKNIFHYTKDFLNRDQSIEKVIIIANPFTFFHFGYLLKKHFPRIRWIADYRDDWNTQFLNQKNKNSLFTKLERNSEKKWVGNASYITAVSDELTKRITKFVGKPGETIANGFFEEVYAA